MSEKHCSDHCQASAAAQHKSILWIVLTINFTMFVVEMTYGLIANSSALLADSLDMLGDSLAYGISLFVISKGLIANARAALFKGLMMAVLGFYVAFITIYNMFGNNLPVGETISIIGGIALVANLVCLFLLLAVRDDNINMKSVWLCSRNDVVANVLVIIAGFYTQSAWPDSLVGIIIAAVVLHSAFYIIKSSREILIS